MKKGKDPAFLFYPSDFLSGTMSFTRLERGAYLDLLILQFNEEKLTLDMIMRTLQGDFEITWPFVKKKFKEDELGYFYNNRLKEEIEKRRKYSESRRKNFEKYNEVKNRNKAFKNETSDSQIHADTHMYTHMDTHMVDHMENENENEIENENGLESMKGGTGGKQYPVVELFQIWRNYKPGYMPQQDRDFPALRIIMERLAEANGMKSDQPQVFPIISATWDAICKYLSTDNFYGSMALFQIEKYLQTIVSKMQEPKPTEKKKESVLEHNMRVHENVQKMIQEKYGNQNQI